MLRMSGVRWNMSSVPATGRRLRMPLSRRRIATPAAQQGNRPAARARIASRSEEQALRKMISLRIASGPIAGGPERLAHPRRARGRRAGCNAPPMIGDHDGARAGPRIRLALGEGFSRQRLDTLAAGSRQAAGDDAVDMRVDLGRGAAAAADEVNCPIGLFEARSRDRDRARPIPPRDGCIQSSARAMAQPVR